VWFYSRTKQRLWKKGEASGNTLQVQSMKLDCDNDALLVKTTPAGPVCHTGADSCFGHEQCSPALTDLFTTIVRRKVSMPKGSYTASLFRAGVDKIALKVSEEALEVIQVAQKETKKRLVEESVDLIYHLFVLLAKKGVALKDIDAEVSKRQR
jgi:phosphoribosyl-ATP pyrophosphohydrolase/phosphoribosyl-AMP cyclohydrolase